MKRILLLLTVFAAGTFLQAQNNFQKAISIPFSSASDVAAISPCSDGGYIFATTQGYYSAGIMKTDANGIVSWSRNFTSDSMYALVAYCAGEINGGGYYLLGGNYDYITGAVNNFMIKMDVNGNTVWTKEFQANLELEGKPNVFQATNGDFLISTIGMEMGLTRLSSNGNVIFQERYGLDTSNSSKIPPLGAAMASDGGVVICSFLTGLGLVKTDASGNILWTKDYYDNSFTNVYYPQGIVATTDGGFAIAGFDYMTNNSFLLKVDGSGNVVWRKMYSSSNQVTFTGLTTTPNGNLQICGMDFFTHAFVAQFDPSGNFISAGIIGNQSSADDAFSSLAIHSCSDNGFVLAGLCQNAITATLATSLFKTDASGNLGCAYHPITMTDISSAFTQPTDAQTPVVRMNVTGAAPQHTINSILNSTVETDFCMLFSVSETVENDISISAFPSPIVSGENLQLNVSGVEGASTILLYDASGKVVKELNQEFSLTAQTSLQIPTTDLSAGIYLVRIIGADQMVLGVTKFIVR